jgi:autotransporter-associated beta strand protein
MTFPPRSLRRRFRTLLALSLASVCASAFGNTYIWQTSGTSPLTDGAGTWSMTGTNWYSVSGNSFGAPGNTTSDADIFGVNNGAAGTITVSGSVTANSITFNQPGSGNYTLTSGTIGLGGATPTITVNANATIGSTLAGTGGVTVNGAGVLTLTGSNAYTGTTTVSLGTLTLDVATGSLKSTSPLTLNNGGTFDINNVGASAAYSGTLGALTFNSGDGTVALAGTVAQNQAITFASLTRNAGATGNFVNAADGIANSAANGFVITGATVNSFLGDAVFYNGASYAWYDAGGFVRAINYGVDAGSATSGAGSTGLSGSTYQQITGAVTGQGNGTFTTINLTSNGSLALGSGSTVTVNGILASGSTASTISGGAGIQAASSADMVIRTDSPSDSLTISSNILNNFSNALTKSGAGTLTLSGSNSYSGVTYLDGGTLLLANAYPLGISPYLTFQGGTLEYSSTNTTDYSNNIHLSTAPISINTNGQNVTFATGLLGSNTGGFTKSGAGTLTLNGAAGYTGGTILNSGTLLIGNASALGGSANSLTVNGGTLNLNGTSQTVGALSGNAGGVITNGTSSTASTLTIQPGSQSATFAGSFQNLAAAAADWRSIICRLPE